MESPVSSEYVGLLTQLKQRIRAAQYHALKAVNQELIALYWDIGKMITDRQKDDSWGKMIIPQLAADLRSEFPGISGFSVSNLWRIKRFFETYSDNEKLAPLVREIGWTHNLLVLEKCKDDLEREFYIRMIRKMGWTKDVLINHIENKTYENTISNQTNFDKTISEDIRDQAKLAVKDEYTFGFLEMADQHKEYELELALLSKMVTFYAKWVGTSRL